MTPQPSSPLAGIPLSAVGVAVIRARESARRDRLYTDTYAAAFAEAARNTFFCGPGPAQGSADQWARIERLADEFYEGRSVGVRMVDDRVRAWVDNGGRQVVMLGAGLDTRAYRMALPADVRWFELDLPEMFEFKEPVLNSVDANPTCDRRILAADLRTDWAASLVAAGFETDIPSAWIDEGAIPYLGHDEAVEVSAIITRLSAPGSEFDTVRASVEENQQRYRDLRNLVSSASGTRPTVRGLGPGAERWLENNGWHTSFQGWDATAMLYERAAAVTGDPMNGVIHAVRTSEKRLGVDRR